ncbi:MAG TPA: sulfotransferase [Steroidobacter sp.]
MAESFDPRVLLEQAAWLERAGRIDEAERAYLQVLSRWPRSPNTWYNLALLQKRAGRYEAALASYQKALDHDISGPEEVHLNRAVIYSDCLRREADAERELQAALKLNPRYVPALLNLANLKEDLGMREQALSLYERILEIEPAFHEARARAANLRVPSSPDEPFIQDLRAALGRPGTSHADKASLGFALGKALDACGAYGEAFEAYTAANHHSKLSARPGTGRYDRSQHEVFISRLIQAFSASIPASSMQSGKRLIFICGMFRSGSTLTEQVLAAHPAVTAGGEIEFLPRLTRTELTPYPEKAGRLSAGEAAALAGRYLSRLEQLFPGADRVTDKRPDNFLHIGLIKRLFPEARIIHTTRHALDNCLSIFFLHLDHSMAYALDLMDTGHYYVQYRRLMAHWKSLYGPDILDFDYDALVREPRAQIARLLEFCGLEWDERCLEFHRAANAVKTASVWQVREPLYSRSSGRWRNYAAQLAPLEDYLRQNCPELSLDP